MNDWTIIREFKGVLPDSTKARTLLEVRCKCGSVEVRRKDHVLNGRTKRCKSCSSKKTLKDNPNHPWLSHKGFGKISVTHYSTIKRGAEIRGLEFQLTIDDLWEIFVRQNGRCALSGVKLVLEPALKNSNVNWDIITASPDRIDNNKGYILGNVQWVHKTLNKMRQALTVEEFVNWCHLVSRFHDNPEPSSSNGEKVEEKVQRLMGEEPTNNPDTSAHPLI